MMIYSAVVLLLAIAFTSGTSYGGGYGGGYGSGFNHFNNRQENFCRPPRVSGLIYEPRKEIYMHGDTIELSCEEGYRFTNKLPSTTCRVFPGFFGNKGVFMPGIFYNTCEELPLCRQPRGMGLIVGSNKTLFEEGESIEISCEEGYELVGSDSYTCQVKNDYYGKTASFGSDAKKACREIMDCYPPTQMGLVVEPMKDMYKPGENISLACEDDYELSVYEIATCQSSGEFLYMRMPRDDGEQEMRDNFFIYYNRVCTRKAKCKMPRYEGLVLSPMKESYESGESVAVSCKDGYEQAGVNTSVCGYKHQWDDFSYIDRAHGYGSFDPDINYHTCKRKPSCDKPRNYGLILSPEKEFYDIGDEVQISCEEGYEQEVAEMATCKKSWYGRHGAFDVRFGSEPCRKKPQCAAPGEEPGLIVEPKKRSYELGEIISLSCAEGYTLTGYNRSTCSRLYQLYRGMGYRFKKIITTFAPSVPEGLCEKVRTTPTTTEPPSRITFSIRPDVETLPTATKPDEQEPKTDADEKEPTPSNPPTTVTLSTTPDASAPDTEEANSEADQEDAPTEETEKAPEPTPTRKLDTPTTAAATMMTEEDEEATENPFEETETTASSEQDTEGPEIDPLGLEEVGIDDEEGKAK